MVNMVTIREEVWWIDQRDEVEEGSEERSEYQRAMRHSGARLATKHNNSYRLDPRRRFREYVLLNISHGGTQVPDTFQPLGKSNNAMQAKLEGPQPLNIGNARHYAWGPS